MRKKGGGGNRKRARKREAGRHGEEGDCHEIIDYPKGSVANNYNFFGTRLQPGFERNGQYVG